MKFIKKYQSPNFDKRKAGSSIEFIIIHYTAMKDDIAAVQHLCKKKSKVSCHFLINKIGKIYYLVDENKRSWHAGKSYWKKPRDLNSQSIGIEIDNSGHHILFENYNKNQIGSLINLLNYLVKKYKINPIKILGHSDIAPYRKIDPGPKFPWKRISKKKLTFFPKKLLKKREKELERFFFKKFSKNQKKKVLFILKGIGYDVNLAIKNDIKYRILVKAYQMHYRQKKISGKIDKETYAILLSHYNEILT